jgi:hypothetical protein
MATKPKTRVSASTKKALNDLRKQRAATMAEIAETRTQQILRVNETMKYRENEVEARETQRHSSQQGRAKSRARRSAVYAINMGAHSRRIKARDGSPIEVEVNFAAATRTLKGWTNFNKVYVGVNSDVFDSAMELEGYQFRSPDSADMMMDSIIGVGFHEIGHNIHSPNYDRVLTIARMKDGDAFDQKTFRKCLNCLDDQRMETAMAIWSPNLARSYTSMITLLLRGSTRLNLMHGRFYLPKTMQEAARADYETAYGIDARRAVEAAIDAFLVADSYDAMADALISYFYATNLGRNCEGGGIPGDDDDGDDMVDQADDEGMTDEEVAEDADAIKDAMKDRKDKGKSPSNQAKNMADDFKSDMAGSNMGDIYKPVAQMHPDDLATADALGRDIAQRLRSAAAGNGLRWQERSRHGVVNGFNYRTRPNRAEMNFFRQETGTSSLGFDIDVSVLLDVSGSMADHMGHLSIVGHAIKLACDELGAYCTVGLYSSGYTVLYPADEKAGGIRLSAETSTVPRMAFEDLPNHRAPGRRQKTHLVIVVTDGQFVRHIAPYEDANQHWLGVAISENDGINSTPGEVVSDRNLINGLERNGFEETRLIRDPLQIAAVLENWLHDTVVVAA